jgi:hypothetical protein
MADRRPGHATPRWVWVGGIITVVLVTILIILLVAGGGSHGPGRHLPAGEPRGTAEPAAWDADGAASMARPQAWS